MTSKQFYITLCIFIVSLKVQRLPCLMCLILDNNTYILFLLYFLIDFLCILLALFILKVLRKRNFLLSQKNKTMAVIVKIALLFVALYFMLQGTLFYEAIQDLFSHILFNNLPWTLFSLLLIACVFYLAQSGIKNIARNFELYFLIIVISYAMLAMFGGLHSDFSTILPFQSIEIKTTAKHFLDYNIWFGDFFIVLFLGANSKNVKLKWTLLTYIVSAAYVLLMVIEYNGIYQYYACMQSSLISMISEQSMLGIDIGRLDWFFILATEIGSILSCGICLHFAKNCLSLTFPKIKSNYMLILLVTALYLVDVLYLVDINSKVELFYNFAGIFALSVKVLSLISMTIASLYVNHKIKTSKLPKEEVKEVMQNE